jgi:long-chain acyl-CoA synthetase
MSAGTTTVVDALRAVAARSPDRPALITPRGAASYEELQTQMDRLACALLDRGIERGARVALTMGNVEAFVVSYLAILAAGATVVPQSPQAPMAVLEHVFKDCQPVAAFADAQVVPTVMALAERCPQLARVYATVASQPGMPEIVDIGEAIGPSGHESRLPSRSLAPASLAAIVYTSGTTGTPKGVMLSHDNMAEIARAGRQLVGLTEDDRIGIVVPLFHLYGLRELDLAFSTGATVVLPRDTNFVASVLADLHDARITGLSSVPSALAILLERHRLDLAACAGHLRYLTIGTAPTPAHLRAELRSMLPRTRLIATYGLTEASRVCYVDITSPDSSLEPGLIGHAYPGVALLLVDEFAAVGRVALRSRMVMAGYWNRPEATSEVLREDGTLLTPDCGRFEADGSLRLLGRMDDVVNCGGQKVSPDEVEEVLASHPGVAAVTVLGAPDPHGVLGQVVHAVVVARNPGAIQAEELMAFARTRLERHKVPRQIEFVDRIPQSVLGKAQRALLREDHSLRNAASS